MAISIYALVTAGATLHGAHPLMREFNLAWQLNSQWRADEAIPLLKQVIAKDKTFHRAYMVLVEAYHQKGELNQAEAYFRSLLAQDPENGLAHYGLGEVYRSKLQWGSAADQYADCIEKSPAASPCYLMMVDALGMFRKHAITTEDFRPGLLLKLRSPFRELTLAWMYRTAHEPKVIAEAQAGLAVARSQNNAELTARLDFVVAGAYSWGKDYARSLAHLEESLRIYRELDDLEMQFEAGKHLGEDNDLANNRDRALSYLEGSLAVARNLGNRRWVATSLVGLGRVYNRHGDQQGALRSFEEAKGLYGVNEMDSALGLLLDMGAMYEETGALERARECFNECRTTARRRGQPWFEAFSLRRLGDTYRDSGDYLKALEALTDAVRMFQGNGFGINAGAGLRVIASVHSALGNYAYARDYYEQSLSEARRFSDVDQQEQTLRGLGRLYIRMEQPQQALKCLQQALALSNRTKNSALRSGTLLDIGEAYRLLGHDEAAIANLSEALQIARHLQIKPEQSAALAALARTHLAKGRLAQAEAYFRESLDLAQQSEFAEVILAAHQGLAETYLRRRERHEALKHFRAAVETIETLRARIPTPELRAGFVEQNWRVYAEIVELLTRLHDREPGAGYDRQAFAYVERGRARAFLDSLAESKARVTKGLTSEQIRQQARLQAELSRASAALLGAVSEPKKLAVKRAEDRLTEWAMELRRSNPRYHELQYPKPYDAQKTQSTLVGTGTIILEYALGEHRSSLWVVTEKQTKMVVLPGRREIEQQVASFRLEIARHPRSNFDAWEAPARHLYKLLLGPIEDFLTHTRDVVIVPDGVLYYLPFESLVSSAEGDPVRCLVEGHAIAYVPSATVFGNLLVEHRKQSPPPAYELLAYGDPVFSAAPSVAGASRMSELVRSVYGAIGVTFPPLPHTRTEIENIGALYPPQRRKIYLGASATEAAVKRENLLAFRRLHFATHAIVDEEVPARSGVVLSLVDTGEEDGILRANEIFNLELNADLVVLSACQTGLGKLAKGEGMVGLTRAFLYAGSPRVVVSLWEVNDLTTGEFMKIFYQKMKHGLNPGFALREAKLEMLHSGSAAYRHPYFWTPFVLVGRF